MGYLKVIVHKFPAGTKAENSKWNSPYLWWDSNLGYAEYEAGV